MAWTIPPKFRAHLPPLYAWLNQISDDLTYLYSELSCRSFAIPEPLRDEQEFDKFDWDAGWKSEYAFVRTEKRWLWYRFPQDPADDAPHLTFANGFGSSRHEDGVTLDPESGANAWNVQDLDDVDGLAQGMIFVVHSVRCAMCRDQSE